MGLSSKDTVMGEVRTAEVLLLEVSFLQFSSTTTGGGGLANVVSLVVDGLLPRSIASSVKNKFRGEVEFIRLFSMLQHRPNFWSHFF